MSMKTKNSAAGRNLTRRERKKLKAIQNRQRSMSQEEIDTRNRIARERKFWRKTQQVRYPDRSGRVVSVDTIPLFDTNYWSPRNPDYVEGVSTETSREMMEHFLKWVNHSGVDMFPQDSREFYSSGNLWIAWSKLLRYSCKYDDTFNPEPYQWFAELEHLITNHSIFWCLVEMVWCKGSYYLNAEEMFSRYGRDQVPFEQRQTWSEHLQVVSTEEKDLDTWVGDNTLPTELTTSLMTSNTIRVGGEEFIPLYRGFRFSEDEVVRCGGWLDQGNQDAGAGWSYSTSLKSAATIGWGITTYHYRETGWSEDEILDHMLEVGHLSKTVRRFDTTLQNGDYTAVGVYGVKTEDILFCINRMGESEVIVSPSKVRLLDYQIMTLADYCAVRTSLDLTAVCADIDDGVTDSNSGRGNVWNADEFYQTNRLLWRQYLQSNHDLKNDLLMNGWRTQTGYRFMEFVSDTADETVSLCAAVFPVDDTTSRSYNLRYSKDNNRYLVAPTTDYRWRLPRDLQVVEVDGLAA